MTNSHLYPQGTPSIHIACDFKSHALFLPLMHKNAVGHGLKYAIASAMHFEAKSHLPKTRKDVKVKIEIQNPFQAVTTSEAVSNRANFTRTNCKRAERKSSLLDTPCVQIVTTYRV